MITGELNAGSPADLMPGPGFGEMPVASLIRSRKFGGVCLHVGVGEGPLIGHIEHGCRFGGIVCLDAFHREEHRGRISWKAKHVSVVENCYWNPPAGRTPGFLSYVPVGEDSEKVVAAKLDEIAAGYPRIDLLCVDVNNHEIEVLESARGSIAKHRPEICVKADAGSWELMDAMLEPLGYRLHRRIQDGYNYYMPDAPWIRSVSVLSRVFPAKFRLKMEAAARKSSMIFRTIARFAIPAGASDFEP